MRIREIQAYEYCRKLKKNTSSQTSDFGNCNGNVGKR